MSSALKASVVVAKRQHQHLVVLSATNHKPAVDLRANVLPGRSAFAAPSRARMGRSAVPTLLLEIQVVSRRAGMKTIVDLAATVAGGGKDV